MITIGFAKHCIASLAEKYLFGTRSARKRSVLLRGEPGIGKSDAIKQVAKELSVKYSEDVIVEDLRLPEYSPVDLKGIPTIKDDRTVFVPVKKLEHDNKPTIIVLEEFDKAYRDTKNVALGLVLDYSIDGRSLPERTFIVATSNRIIDNADSKPLASTYRAGRFIILDVTFNLNEFLNYARSNFHPCVRWFLETNNDMAHVPVYNDNILMEDSYPCPRSWETLSCFLNDSFNTSEDDIIKKIIESSLSYTSVISGIIGKEAASRFVSYLEYISGIDLDSILNGGKISIENADDGIRKPLAVAYLIDKKYRNKKIDKETMSKMVRLLKCENMSLVATKRILSTILTNASSRSELLKIAGDDKAISKIINDFRDIKEEMRLAGCYYE